MKYESNLAVSSHGDSCIIFTDIRSGPRLQPPCADILGQVSLEIKTKANGSAFDMNLSQYLLVTGGLYHLNYAFNPLIASSTLLTC